MFDVVYVYISIGVRERFVFVLKIRRNSENTLCGQNAEFLNVNAGVMYSYVCNLKGRTTAGSDVMLKCKFTCGTVQTSRHSRS